MASAVKAYPGRVDIGQLLHVFDDRETVVERGGIVADGWHVRGAPVTATVIGDRDNEALFLRREGAFVLGSPLSLHLALFGATPKSPGLATVKRRIGYRIRNRPPRIRC